MTHHDTVAAAKENVSAAVRRCLRHRDSRDRNEALHAEARALYLEGGARELLEMASAVGLKVPKKIFTELPSSPP